MDSFEKYVGQIFDRRYKIVKIIGYGGMAIVFEAYDLLKNRPVAVKMLKDDIAKDAQAVRRFINESKAVAMLSHPNIVSIYDVSVKDDLKYIVMELIEGITLKNYMQKKGALPFKEVVSISEQILRALEHAHSKGIVHRDIKPQNIMLLKNGSIKVADFGIAKLPDAETVTVTDKAIGTVFYISPEQASGKVIDARSDLYSLGATMYEMATGKLPFTADTPVSVALMQVKTIPKNPREFNEAIPRGLEQIILIAMEKNPAHRFQSASQMLRHLLQIKTNPKVVFKVTEHSTDNENLVSKKVEQPAKQKSQSYSMFPTIMGIVLAFLIVAAVSAVNIIGAFIEASKNTGEVTLNIGNYLGETYDNEFKLERENEHYNVIVERVFSQDPADTIIKQSPKPKEQRKVYPNDNSGKLDTKCDLYLTVSLGSEEIILKDYKYRYAPSVKDELKEYKLVIVEEHVYSDYIPASYIVACDPAPGSTVTQGDTVTLSISRGPNYENITVEIPEFDGKTVQEAKQLLKANELKLGRVDYKHSPSANGTIISHTISQAAIKNGKVLKGAEVNFIVSLGEEKPEETTAKEPEVTENTQTTDIPVAANPFETSEDSTEADTTEIDTTLDTAKQTSDSTEIDTTIAIDIPDVTTDDGEETQPSNPWMSHGIVYNSELLANE